MKETVYEVVPSGDRWALQLQGTTRKEIFASRDEAIANGRILCKQHRPSRLRVRKEDSSPQG
jgi:hypothetical protein